MEGCGEGSEDRGQPLPLVDGSFAEGVGRRRLMWQQLSPPPQQGLTEATLSPGKQVHAGTENSVREQAL